MDTRKLGFIVLVVLNLLILPTFGVAGQAAERVETTLFLTFVPNIQFSPVYVALEKGYFEEAGFDVTIEHGDEPIGVDLIAAGARQFGVISGEQVITARANERPVVYVYDWFHQFPVGVVAVEGSGIESVEDLAGQRVGISGRFGASYTGVNALLAANGMSESDIQLEEIGFNAPEVICVGAIEAAVVYLNNEPLQIEERAAAGDCGDVTGLVSFPVADQVNLVSNGLVTNEQMIAEHPEQVQAFVAAFDRGLRDTLQNPAEAYLLSANYVENLPLDDALRAALEQAAEEQRQFLADTDADRETLQARLGDLFEGLAAQFEPQSLRQMAVLRASLPLWDQDRPGYSDPAAWETMQDTLLSLGPLGDPIALEDAFTNDFLPKVDEE